MSRLSVSRFCRAAPKGWLAVNVAIGFLAVAAQTARAESTTTCRDLVEAIARSTDAKLDTTEQQSFWVPLSTSGAIRIDITCYGDVAEAIAEVVLEGSAPTDEFFERIGEVGRAMSEQATPAGEQTATARACVASAQATSSNQAEREASGLRYTCVAGASREPMLQSTLVSITPSREPTAASRSASVAPPATSPRKKQSRPTRRPEPHPCPWSW